MQGVLEKLYLVFACLPLHALCVSVAAERGSFGDDGKDVPALTSYRSVSEFSD